MQMVPVDTAKCWRRRLNTGTAAMLSMDTCWPVEEAKSLRKLPST